MFSVLFGISVVVFVCLCEYYSEGCEWILMKFLAVLGCGSVSSLSDFSANLNCSPCLGFSKILCSLFAYAATNDWYFIEAELS